MIITIISAICLIAGILLLCLNNSCHWYNDMIDLIGFLFVVAGAVSLGICLVMIIVAHINVDAHLQALQNTRDMLIYRLEHVNELPVGNEMLYSEITEFNNQLYENIINSRNPWINWFYNSEFNNIPLIPWR